MSTQARTHGNFVVLPSANISAKVASFPISQAELHEIATRKARIERDLRVIRQMEEQIAASLLAGGEVEPGQRTAELSIERAQGAPGESGVVIKLVLLSICFFLSLIPARAQQDMSSKRARKDQAKIEKQKAIDREWEKQTEPPYPDHPASIRPEFQTAIRQAAGLIDNAFNTIPSSRIEFSIANQSAQQAVAIIKGSTETEGEMQAIETLAAYAEIVPICQQAAWDSVSNIIILAAGNYGKCQREARRRRAIAEKTLTRNSRSAPPDIPMEQPVSSASEPDRILTVPPSKYGAVSVRFVSTRKQRVLIDVDSSGEKMEIYDVGFGASFVVSRSLFLSSTALEDLQFFIGEILIPVKGKSIQLLVKK